MIWKDPVANENLAAFFPEDRPRVVEEVRGEKTGILLCGSWRCIVNRVCRATNQGIEGRADRSALPSAMFRVIS